MSRLQTYEGMLIECDVPTMQIIELLDREHSLIIRKLDETHVFIQQDMLGLVEDEVRALLVEGIYDASDEKKRKRGLRSSSRRT